MRLSDDTRESLARSAAIREEMRREVEAGITSSGPHGDFLRRVAHDLVEVMCEEAETFNSTHKDLMISTAYLLDVLVSARLMLLAAADRMKGMLAQDEVRTDG